MPITALPNETRALIGSTCTIDNPVSLVKELVDNGIDANARTVEVLISPNTIDKVEVRDDGVGIHPDDYDSLCRQGHTSKLRTAEDLQTVASRSLGFRGEALANANTIARLTITTRTSADTVAAILHINPKEGGILKKQSGSAPAGTKVSLTQLYYGFPVREQSAAKEARKTLDRVRDLLRCYAIARPEVRFSLKVLGKPSSDWKYSPGRNASYGEAILQVLGKEVTSRCLEKTISFSSVTGPENISVDTFNHTKPIFTFHAFLWNPDFEIVRIPKCRFFSVDRRPVTSTRGTMHKLMLIYNKHLASAFRIQADMRGVCNAFICLDIRCPEGAYDANIEPSKDDVVFEDEHAIIERFKALCEDVYGTQIESDGHTSNNRQKNYVQPIERTKGVSRPTGDQSSCVQAVLTHSKVLGDHSVDGSKSTTIQNDKATEKQVQQSSLNELRQTPRNSSDYRPHATCSSEWKAINLSVPPQSKDDSTLTLLAHNRPSADDEHDVSDIVHEFSAAASQLASNSERNPCSDTYITSNMKEVPALMDHNSPSRTSFNDLSLLGMDTQVARARSQVDMLPTLTLPRAAARAFPASPEPAVLRHPGAPPRDLEFPESMYRTYYDKIKALPQNADDSIIAGPVGCMPHQTRASSHRHPQPPWTPPSSIQRSQGQWHSRYSTMRQPPPDGLKQTTISFGSRNQRQPTHGRSGLGTGHSRRGEPACDEYKRKKPGPGDFVPASQYKNAMDSANMYPSPSSTETPLTQTRHCMRQDPSQAPAFAQLCTMNIQTNDTMERDREVIKTSLPTGDPRAYLLRRQKSIAADENAGMPKKIRRMRSSLLPLETSELEMQTRRLIFPVQVSMNRLLGLLTCFGQHDKYIMEGDVEEALDMSLADSRDIEARLDAILSG